MNVHNWKVTPKDAIQIQKELRSKIQIERLKHPPRLIGGADVSMNLYSTTVFAGFVVLSFPQMQIVDHSVVKDEVTFPYIPGLLSFREIPSLLKAWDKLKTKPDVVMVDGVGIAHPRRMGIATHLGLCIDVPTLGCAKNILTGVADELDPLKGSTAYLRDRSDPEEIIGAAIRTKDKVKPIYVSPGHKITLEESIDLVQRSSLKHRMPEPTRQAHLLMNEFRKKGDEQPLTLFG